MIEKIARKVGEREREGGGGGGAGTSYMHENYTKDQVFSFFSFETVYDGQSRLFRLSLVMKRIQL